MPDTTTRLTISIDVAAASAKANELVGKLKELGQSGESAGIQIDSGMRRGKQGMDMLGESATTNAVRFQTATQGLLNLSTTAVQTYTSISNLARAQNRAEAAAVGQRRAQDALNRFQIKYNKLVESGTASTRDLTQAQNELNTAMEDYKVKAEKAKIESEAVFDIQLLFFANIANVGVSSLQVIGSMLSAHTKTMIANTIQTKFNSIEKWNNTYSLTANSGAANANAYAYNRNAIAMSAANVQTKALTWSQRALNVAMGPIGWIALGASAAFTVYETNAWGAKDAINGLLGIQDELADSMDEGGASADDFAKELNRLSDTAGKKLPDSFKKLKDEIIKVRAEMKNTTSAANELFYGTEFIRNQSFGGITGTGIKQKGFPEGGITAQSITGNIQQQTATNFMGSGNGTPQALGYLVIEANKRGIKIGDSTIVPIERTLDMGFPKGLDFSDLKSNLYALKNGYELPTVTEEKMIQEVLRRAGILVEAYQMLDPSKKQEIRKMALRLAVLEPVLNNDEKERLYADLVNEQLLAEGKPTKLFFDTRYIQNILDPELHMETALLADEAEFKNLSFLPDVRSRPAFMAALLREGRHDLLKLVDPKYRNFILNGRPMSAETRKKYNMALNFMEGKRIDAYGLSGLNKSKTATVMQLTRFLSFSALNSESAPILRALNITPFDSLGGTRNIIIDSKTNKKLKRIEESGSAVRGEIFVATGIDIGAVADTLPFEDAIRIAQLEANLRDGLFIRSPENLFRAGLLNKSGFEFHGITMVGTKTGYDRDGIPFKVNGRMMEVNLNGKKITLPIHDEEVMNNINEYTRQSNLEMQRGISRNQDLVALGLVSSGKAGNFGSGFFSAFKGAGGLGGYAGLSATAAYQSIGQPKVDPIFREMRKASDNYVNSGQIYADIGLQFAKTGTLRRTVLSRSAASSDLAKKISRQLGVARAFNSAYGFGSSISDSLLNRIYDTGFEREAELGFNYGNRIDQAGDISGVLGLRTMLLKDVFKPILSSIGLDTDFIQKLAPLSSLPYYQQRPWLKKTNQYTTVGLSPEDLLRQDLGLAGAAGYGVVTPRVNESLVQKALIFYQNKFSDFNNMEIAQQAYDVLIPEQKLSKQSIWNIRFNTTRGDRELYNRLRYERKEAASSGGSVI